MATKCPKNGEWCFKPKCGTTTAICYPSQDDAIAIHLKGTNEAYLLHFPQTASEDPMPMHDKIIVQLLAEIEAVKPVVAPSEEVKHLKAIKNGLKACNINLIDSPNSEYLKGYKAALQSVIDILENKPF